MTLVKPDGSPLVQTETKEHQQYSVLYRAWAEHLVSRVLTSELRGFTALPWTREVIGPLLAQLGVGDDGILIGGPVSYGLRGKHQTMFAVFPKPHVVQAGGGITRPEVEINAVIQTPTAGKLTPRQRMGAMQDALGDATYRALAKRTAEVRVHEATVTYGAFIVDEMPPSDQS